LDANKSELKERRLASMDRKRQAEISLAEKRKDRIYQEEKHTLRAQMAVDDANRQILADLKAEEKAREEAAMYESFKQLKVKQQEQEDQQAKKSTPSLSVNQQEHSGGKPATSMKKRVSFASEIEDPTTKPAPKEQTPEVLELSSDGSFDVVRTTPSTMIWGDGTDEAPALDEDLNAHEDNQTDNHHSAIPVEDTQHAEDVELVEDVELPPPRAPAQTVIHFTPRLFPTPSRESKAAEEDDWMLKNRKHLKKHKGLRGAYDISESDRACPTSLCF
jgi:dyslexia susceptibility 1 candidate gene 1 protein